MVEGEQANPAYERLGENGRGKVDGVQGTDRLSGEGTASSFNDLGPDSENGPVFRRLSQPRATAGDLAFGEFAGAHRADKHPIALNEGKVRSEDEFGLGEGLTDSPRMGFTQEPRQNRARLGVEIQDSPRSCSRSRITSASGSRGSITGYKSGLFPAPNRALPSLASRTSPG